MINELLERFAAWAKARNPKTEAEPKPRIWAYTIEDYIDGSPYLTRVLFPRVFGFRPMLHHFHRPDGDRALHSHPWTWAAALILRGSYTEERLLDDEEINGTRTRRTQTRLVRWFNVLTKHDFHRVVELHGDVWTLFVAGEKTQGWGFLEDGNERATPWRQYIDRKILEKRIESAIGDELDEIGRTVPDHPMKRAKDDSSMGPNWTESDNGYRNRIKRWLGMK